MWVTFADAVCIFMNFNGDVVKQNGKDTLCFHKEV